MEKKQQQVRVVYDPPILREFVFATADGDTTKAITLIDSILKNAANDSLVFIHVANYLERYFSDPNSPYRNQCFYSHLLEQELASSWFKDEEKEQVSAKLRLLNENNIGNPANDFNYKTSSGQRKRMYDLDARFLLLFFYNPECQACKEMKSSLIASSVINNEVATGQLKVLAVYTDKDETVWLNHLTEFPKIWVQGRDEDEFLWKNKVYDLKAIPTVYLLDIDKRVLLKDCMDVKAIEKNLTK